MALHLLVLVIRKVDELSGTVQGNKVCECASVYIKHLDKRQSVIQQTFLTTDVFCVISGRNYDCISQKCGLLTKSGRF
jgi:hypothetical protein